MARSILACALFAGLALSSVHVGMVDKRQSCSYGEGYFPECGTCCNDLGFAGCYAPVDGPDAGEWACYDYPPGEIVSTVYHSSSVYYSSGGSYASSSDAYGGYSSSAPSYATASSYPNYGSSSSADGSYGYSSSSDSNPGYTPGPSLPSPSTSFGLPGPSDTASPSQIASGGASETAGKPGWVWRFVAGAVGVVFWL